MLVINRGYPRTSMRLCWATKVVIQTLTQQEYLWHAGFVVRMLSAIVMATFFSAVVRWIARWRTIAEMQPKVSEEAAS